MVGKHLAGGTAVCVLVADIDEVLLAEPTVGLGSRGQRPWHVWRRAGLLAGEYLLA